MAAPLVQQKNVADAWNAAPGYMAIRHPAKIACQVYRPPTDAINRHATSGGEFEGEQGCYLTVQRMLAGGWRLGEPEGLGPGLSERGGHAPSIARGCG